MRRRAASAIVAATLAVALGFGANAEAKCFATGTDLPAKASFGDGSVATVLDRADETLSYRMTTPGGDATEMRAKAGLFPIETKAGGTTTSFEWQPAPPAMSDLDIGRTFDHTAAIRSGSGEPRTMKSKLSVLSRETVTIDGCDYPVLMVLQENRYGEATPALVTRYLHLPSMLTLRTIIGTPVRPGAQPRTIEHQITKLD